jgi:hypothetical protein
MNVRVAMGLTTSLTQGVGESTEMAIPFTDPAKEATNLAPSFAEPVREVTEWAISPTPNLPKRFHLVGRNSSTPSQCQGSQILHSDFISEFAKQSSFAQRVEQTVAIIRRQQIQLLAVSLQAHTQKTLVMNLLVLSVKVFEQLFRHVL